MAGLQYVYRDAKLTKQLKALSRGGANAAQAVGHAMTIINEFVAGNIRNPKLMGRLTRYGDARIKNCIKFDLVRGYRLVAVLMDEGIAFLFVGSHDECDHWLRNNAGLEPILDKQRNTVMETGQATCEPPWVESEHEIIESDDYDKSVLAKITQQDLRKIFCGLVKNSDVGQ